MLKANPAVKWTKIAISSLDLAGKQITIVGGTDGLGRAIAKKAAARGANVTVVGRTFRDQGVERINFVKCDLSLMSEAAKLGSTLPGQQNVIVLTNGIVAAPQRQETPEGLERDMAVSFLSRFVILKNLVPRLDSSAKPRIFNMGYPGAGQAGTLGDLNAEKSYKTMEVHMNTVAGNEALVVHGATAWKDRGVTTFGLNPGLIQTGIRANYLGSGFISGAVEWAIGKFNISPERYADNIVPLLVAPELSAHNGAMFNQSGDAILPTPAFADPAYVARFLAESEALIAKALPQR